ncbi:MAG: hypothetical protein IPM45_05805 [Acidimicrobiales bacterium]|nr:hypothetical protein [Acidimicrobiales bacterium]
MLLDLITVAVLAFVGVRLVGAARLSVRSAAARARVRVVLAGLRPRHFLRAPLVLAAVLGASVVLLQVPLLDIGWWSAIGGVGNPVAGSTTRTAGTALEWLIPLVFVILLVPALPLFAESEERAFRLGCERWSWPKRVERAVVFGLAHAVIGIPIGVALALGLGGAYFQWCYLRGYRRGGVEAAVLESTRAHLAYNLEIVLLLLLALALTIAGVE